MALLFKAIVKEPQKTTYEGKDNDEQILYVIRESTLTLIPKLFVFFLAVVAPFFIYPVISGVNARNHLMNEVFLLTLLLFWYVIIFGYLLSVSINWYFNLFIITNKKIVDMDVRGLLYKNISEAALRNIEDVTSTVKGTLGTIFNVGEVFLQTAGEEKEFEFNYVDNPSEIRDIISDLVSNLKEHGQNN